MLEFVCHFSFKAASDLWHICPQFRETMTFLLALQSLWDRDYCIENCGHKN